MLAVTILFSFIGYVIAGDHYYLGEMEGDSREIFILRQELSDRDETICQLRKENEANEDTIKMLKKRLQHLDDQSSSAGVVKKEQKEIKPPLFHSFEQGTHTPMHKHLSMFM